jgi:vacuolar protein sorting-associated protein 35
MIEPKSPNLENVGPVADGGKEGDAAGEAEGVKSPVTEQKEAVHKFRGIPEDVKLFEMFWEQVVQLIRVSRS